jgi:hypothetical protein
MSWRKLTSFFVACITMPKVPTHVKRPRDFSQAAKLVVDIASGQVEDREPRPFAFRFEQIVRSGPLRSDRISYVEGVRVDGSLPPYRIVGSNSESAGRVPDTADMAGKQLSTQHDPWIERNFCADPVLLKPARAAGWGQSEERARAATT